MNSVCLQKHLWVGWLEFTVSSLLLVSSLSLPSAPQLSIPFRISSSLHFYLFFTYLFQDQDWHHLFLLTPFHLIYPAFPMLLHSLQLSSYPPYLLLPSSLHPTLYFFFCLPSITPFITSSNHHLSMDNLPAVCRLQPSQIDPVRGLMLWKMTANRHFHCHHQRFGAACRLQPCCLATPQTASIQKARAPVCCAAIETRA